MDHSGIAPVVGVFLQKKEPQCEHEVLDRRWRPTAALCEMPNEGRDIFACRRLNRNAEGALEGANACRVGVGRTNAAATNCEVVDDGLVV